MFVVKNKLCILGLTGGVLCLSSAAIWWRGSQVDEARFSLLAELVDSSGQDAFGRFECEPYAKVRFDYKIINGGAQPLTGIRVARSCACQSVNELPSQIAPGDSAQFSVEVQAPGIGESQKSININCNEIAGSALTLRPKILVKNKVPYLLSTLGSIQSTFIEGDIKTSKFSIITTEARDTDNWIQGIRCSMGDSLKMTQLRVTTQAADQNFEVRRYHFTMEHGLDPGDHRSTIQFETSADMPKIDKHVPLTVSVKDPVVVLPGSIAVQSGEVYRVSVLQRGPGSLTAKPLFDAGEVDVILRSQSDSVAVFDVVVRDDCPEQTSIEFDVGTYGSRILPVRSIAAN